MENQEVYQDEYGEITYTQAHLDKVEQFREKMFSQDIEQKPYKKSDSSETPSKVLIRPPLGTFDGNTYEPPEYNRLTYMNIVNQYYRSINYKGYSEIRSPRLYFRETNDQINFFHPDFIKVFNNFLLAYKYEQIVIVQAMSVPNNDFVTPHNIGMAIDIFAENQEQRNHIMNTAWAAGFPNIAQVGDGTADVHIHLDICPRVDFLYDGIYYEGPWSLSRFV